MNSTRRTRRTRRTARGAVAVAAAAVLGLGVSGCGSGHPAARAGSGSAGGPSAAASAPAAGHHGAEPLAVIKGPSGIVITLTSAVRSAGGFVTVSGTVRNTGSQPFTGTSQWRGNEEALQRNGGSMAGATLVDPSGKKRYYVLRDTEGRCLCTTGLDIIAPGATMPVYAQFPAPPPTTTQVEFDLPTLPAASIVISE